MEQFHQHDLERLWYRLKPDERRCVYAYRVSASKAEAARRIGKNQKWLEYSSRAHPEFREAMDRAWEWDHDEMKRLTYADLRDTAMVTLVELMRADSPQARQRLKAAELLLKATSRRSSMN